MPARRYSWIALAATIAAALFSTLPTLAESRIEKQLALAPGGRLTVDTDAGSVTVRGTARSGARIVITSPSDTIESDFTFDIKESAGLVEVKARRKNAEKYGLLSWLMSSGRTSLTYEIEVPRQTAVAVDTSGGAITVEALEGATQLDTSGGSIHVTDIRGPLTVDTSGGSITIEKVDGNVVADTSGGSIEVQGVKGTAHLDTSGGSIRVSGVTGDLTAGTSGGSIRISDAGGRVDAETSGGPVDVEFVAGNERGGTISSSGGGVRVAVDPTADLEIDASASGGSVTSGLQLTHSESSRGSLRGKLGAGGERLEVSASGGSVKLEAL